jgi:hypothetical protein
VHWTATPATNDTGSTASVQNRVFAGWCRDADGANLFENPAHQCWENGLAVGTPCAGTYESCEQYHNGAFGPSGGNNKTINQIGSAPGCLADELPHAAKLIGPMRFPPTFGISVDQVTSMPGPGTMGLDGTMQLQ